LPVLAKVIDVEVTRSTDLTSMHGTILLERALPLSWTLLPEAPPALDTEQNHLVFNLLDNLEDPVSRKTEGDNANEWQRIEAKLNVIMQLLSQLLQSRQSAQPAVVVRCSSDSLAWQVEQLAPVGSLLQVTLSPENSIPMAITFTARVFEVKDGWMEVDMHGLSEEEQMIWSRWVFRQHRRQVAQARSLSASQDQAD
jgi:hypothetical protein